MRQPQPPARLCAHPTPAPRQLQRPHPGGQLPQWTDNLVNPDPETNRRLELLEKALNSPDLLKDETTKAAVRDLYFRAPYLTMRMLLFHQPSADSKQGALPAITALTAITGDMQYAGRSLGLTFRLKVLERFVGQSELADARITTLVEQNEQELLGIAERSSFGRVIKESLARISKSLSD